MIKGLIHGHQGLAYLLVLSSSLSVTLSLVNALMGSKPGIVRFGTLLGRRVEPALMGIIALLGVGAWIGAGLPITKITMWLGVVALVVQGMAVGKLTKPALIALGGGDTEAKWRWVIAAVVNAVIVFGIFGAMQAS